MISLFYILFQKRAISSSIIKGPFDETNGILPGNKKNNISVNIKSQICAGIPGNDHPCKLDQSLALASLQLNNIWSGSLSCNSSNVKRVPK